MAVTAKTTYTFDGGNLTVDSLTTLLTSLKTMGCPGTAKIALPTRIDVVIDHALVAGQLNDLSDAIISPLEPIAVH